MIRSCSAFRAADTRAAMPSLAGVAQVGDAALVSVTPGAEVPGKSSIRPRPQSSIAGRSIG